MATVAIHPPKTPITSGVNKGTAKNTLPNVCKMPGPPAPFVPSPLPNIAKSNLSPKGFSKDVKIEGDTVAIFGATFESIGDVASKATGGGLLSMNTHGPAKFITPGSLTVSIEGKAVHLKGEMMLNNLGPSGAPPNTGATMSGADRDDTDADAKIPLECGELGTYRDLCKKDAAGPGMERDHVPSCAALNQRALNIANKKGIALSDAAKTCIKNGTRNNGLAVAIPKGVHAEFSETYKSANKPLYPDDAKSAAKMDEAKERDTKSVQEGLDGKDKDCAKAYSEAAKKIKEFDTESMIKKVINECKGK